jgi:hypothetical protein
MSFTLNNLKDLLDGKFEETKAVNKPTLSDVFWGGQTQPSPVDKELEDIFEDLVEDGELKDLSFLDVIPPHPDTHNPEQFEHIVYPEDHE